MRIDEALLRERAEDEFAEWPTKNSIAESLQLVHYAPGQKYTAHHGKKPGAVPVRFCITQESLA
jgi:hypothetical protein